jgi:hypothetical protein
MQVGDDAHGEGKGSGRGEVGSGPTVRNKHFTKTFLHFLSSNNTFHEVSETEDLATGITHTLPLPR